MKVGHTDLSDAVGGGRAAARPMRPSRLVIVVIMANFRDFMID